MKYYVLSGTIRAVIAGPHIENEEDAACEVVMKYLPKGHGIAPIILVSERGFDCNEHEGDEDKVFATIDILKKSGMLEE